MSMNRDDKILEVPLKTAACGDRHRRGLTPSAAKHGASGWVWLGLGRGIERIDDEDLGEMLVLQRSRRWLH